VTARTSDGNSACVTNGADQSAWSSRNEKYGVPARHGSGYSRRMRSVILLSKSRRNVEGYRRRGTTLLFSYGPRIVAELSESALGATSYRVASVDYELLYLIVFTSCNSRSATSRGRGAYPRAEHCFWPSVSTHSSSSTSAAFLELSAISSGSTSHVKVAIG
jgi:hypothetical protein